MRSAIKAYDEGKAAIIEKLNNDILSYSLEADKIIYTLLQKSEYHLTTNDLLSKAKTQFDLGKPPGKNRSYGDALNWETVLQFVPDSEDLYFVSEDKDYYSELDAARFNYYLYDE